MKRLFTALFIFTNLVLTAQTLPSPSIFLGYELGSRFTPHHKIEAFFQMAAKASPQKMKLQQYGSTYEGRPLLMAVITSESNMNRLEDIRKNNLRLTGLLNDQPANTNMPVIVWLSYNVHGNEASSSEVSMKVLFELLQSSDSRIQQWLEKTVIIIDPCLNPDGRDRYVNWYNMSVGKNVNANADGREHNEPWPGGRTNHYNFDLNRDWAWQSQIETQQRIKIYNQWMPEVHVDFHEQYPGSPYYFAPAAEPFHEVITPFQRSIQNDFGRNHAKYFDANGWLYFTKEYFDLFYPAYGDTYPIYNGSIGMTYEQAGHSLAGLAIALDGDDTLKLTDRIAHHYTTSLSTIETAAANAGTILNEFKKYFSESTTNGSGLYATYVVRGSEKGKLQSLLALLDRNQIQYAFAGKAGPVKGYNYFSGKEGSYTTSSVDVIIPAAQPKANLLRVLFEPQSKLSDSATYDITAWSLPYVYGIETYAIKEKITGTVSALKEEGFALKENAYGYLIPYEFLNDGKLLAALLTEGFKVRIAEKPFSYSKRNFRSGTLVILRSGNENRWKQLETLIRSNKNEAIMVSSGFMESGFDFGSDKLHLIKKPNVAVLTGKGVSETAAGEVWHFFDQQLEYNVTMINQLDLGDVSLKKYDVLIMPDGNYKIFEDKESAASLKDWVRQGGKLIAMEGAVAQLSAAEWGLKLKKEDEKTDEKPTYDDLKKYANREKDYLVNTIPGAIYKLELDNTHPLAFGYPDFYFTMKRDGSTYDFLKTGWNVGVFKKDKQVSGFVGNKLRNKIQDGTSIAVQQMGRGNVVYFTDDPLFRSFWENGKLMFTNAVFFVGQ